MKHKGLDVFLSVSRAVVSSCYLAISGLYCRDFKTISKHMGYSRTPGACKSYFSKNRHRLGLDSVLAEHQRGKDEIDEGELEADPKVRQLPTGPYQMKW